MELFIPIIAIISVFGSTVWIISLITNYILKRKLIEKGMVNEETINLFSRTTNRQNSLKWGLIILFTGIGLIINNSMDADPETALPYGIEAVSISLGFLAYYFMVRNETE